MNTLSRLGLLAAAAALTGFQPAQGQPPATGAEPAPACFRTHEIRGHTVGDDHTIYLNVRDRDFYRVDVSKPCLAGATSSDFIVIRNPPGSDIVCRPIQLDVGVNTGGATSRCIVNSVTPMTPAEVAALPPKVRP